MFEPSSNESKRNLCVTGTLKTAVACELHPLRSTPSSRGRNATRKVGEVMSFRFLERCALPALLALLPIGAAFSQPTSARSQISANDFVRTVVANELKAQSESHGRWMYRVDKEEQNKQKAKEVVQTGQGSLERLVAKFSSAAKTRANEEKRYGAMQSIFHDASRCSHLHLCRSGRRPDHAELPAESEFSTPFTGGSSLS